MNYFKSCLLKPASAIMSCALALLSQVYGEDMVSENAKLIVREAMKNPSGESFEYELQRVSDMDQETVEHAVVSLGERLDLIRGRNGTVAALRLLRRSKHPMTESTQTWAILQSKSDVADVRDLANDLLYFQQIVATEAKKGVDLPAVDEGLLLAQFSSDLENGFLYPRAIAQFVGMRQEKTSGLIDKAIVVMQKEPGGLPLRINVLRVLERYRGMLSEPQLNFLSECMKDSDPLVATVARNVKEVVDKSSR